jgi:hypothetical protein
MLAHVLASLVLVIAALPASAQDIQRLKRDSSIAGARASGMNWSIAGRCNQPKAVLDEIASNARRKFAIEGVDFDAEFGAGVATERETHVSSIHTIRVGGGEQAARDAEAQECATAEERRQRHKR